MYNPEPFFFFQIKKIFKREMRLVSKGVKEARK